MIDNLIVYCADVGSVAKHCFGWARGLPGAEAEGFDDGADMGELADRIAADLNDAKPVALGFECPLFVPIRADPKELTSKRRGEGNRAWSAAGGSGSLTTGLVQAVWVLREVRDRLDAPDVPVFLDWPTFAQRKAGLFLWEAFVSGDAKHRGDVTSLHRGDARIAVRTFLAALPDPLEADAVDEDEVHSLIGAAVLRVGWDDDLSLLCTPSLVIRA